MPGILKLVGQRFGKLTVIKRLNKQKQGNYYWKCVCDCGKVVEVKGGYLISGDTTSCGCAKDHVNGVHNHSNPPSKTYRAWVNMKGRCDNKKLPDYKWYGGRGIKVCERWASSFEAFLQDMGESPEGLSLDRINVDGNYEPGNCRWATIEQQNNNRRDRDFNLEAVTKILRFVGEDPDREGLRETPKRVLKAWEFWTSGYSADVKSLFTTFKDGFEKYDELIFEGSIPVYSCCEHHMTPFFGEAFIGYVPNGKIIGLSKMARLVDAFSRRLTVQERITNQVADTMMTYLKPLGVGVVLRCRHLCIESRGVQKPGTVTVTSALRGCFRSKAPARAEFMSMVTEHTTV